MELIDTLWNVNSLDRAAFLVGCTGINRYIMECKFAVIFFGGTAIFELIDTLWNVNWVNSCSVLCRWGINRYIMECK